MTRIDLIRRWVAEHYSDESKRLVTEGAEPLKADRDRFAAADRAGLFTPGQAKHPHRTMGLAYSVCIDCGHGRGYALHTDATDEREGVRRAYELTYGRPMPESFGR